ncbi:unnamed protein product [Sphagnum balticum]
MVVHQRLAYIPTATGGGGGGGSPWVGAVITVGLLISPVALPHLSRRLKTLMRPRRCSQCLGVGNNLCVFCKGRGKQGGLFTGSALERCSVCEGRGRQLCMPCAGSGLANHWLYTPVDRGAWGPRGS